MHDNTPPPATPTLGVSECLMGANVRYNGGNKLARLCTEDLAQLVHFRSFCPELGAGMGVPRPPVRLVRRGDETRVEYSDGSGVDVTDRLAGYSQAIIETLHDLDGFIFMNRSPSCGPAGVKVYTPTGQPFASQGGVFATAVKARYPLLPVEDIGRLSDERLRENFILRVFIHHEWRTHTRPAVAAASLIRFHTRHKFQLMAHSPEGYRQLGRLLSDLTTAPITDIADRYFTQLIAALSRPASRQRHANTLQHLQGYVKHFLSSEQRRDISQVIEEYRVGRVPLIVPVTLIRHAAVAHPEETQYLAEQSYLNPYPARLGLRNAI